MGFCNLANKFMRYLARHQDLSSPSRHSVAQGVVVNISPFNAQYNRLVLDIEDMRRRNAKPEEISEYIQTHPITTTEGQLRFPRTAP